MIKTVDWLDIVKKCRAKYPEMSKQGVFAYRQIVDFNIELFKRSYDTHLSHIGTHKGIYDPFGERKVLDKDNPKAKMLKSMRMAAFGWLGQPDLTCDDPLYDGQAVR